MKTTFSALSATALLALLSPSVSHSTTGNPYPNSVTICREKAENPIGFVFVTQAEASSDYTSFYAWPFGPEWTKFFDASLMQGRVSSFDSSSRTLVLQPADEGYNLALVFGLNNYGGGQAGDTPKAVKFELRTVASRHGPAGKTTSMPLLCCSGSVPVTRDGHLTCAGGGSREFHQGIESLTKEIMTFSKITPEQRADAVHRLLDWEKRGDQVVPPVPTEGGGSGLGGSHTTGGLIFLGS